MILRFFLPSLFEVRASESSFFFCWTGKFIVVHILHVSIASFSVIKLKRCMNEKIVSIFQKFQFSRKLVCDKKKFSILLILCFRLSRARLHVASFFDVVINHFLNKQTKLITASGKLSWFIYDPSERAGR